MLKDFQKSHYHLLKTANTADPSPQIDSECGLRQNPPNKTPKKLSKSHKDFREFFVCPTCNIPTLRGDT